MDVSKKSLLALLEYINKRNNIEQLETVRSNITALLDLLELHIPVLRAIEKVEKEFSDIRKLYTNDVKSSTID